MRCIKLSVPSMVAQKKLITKIEAQAVMDSARRARRLLGGLKELESVRRKTQRASQPQFTGSTLLLT